MRSPVRCRPALLLAAAAVPGLTFAHSFGVQYTLPVPFWMYAYGATAALVLSFVIVGIFAAVPPARSETSPNARRVGTHVFVPAFVVQGLRALSVGLLALTIACGFLGTDNPFRNLNMTLFWIVFVLGLTYATAVVGDLFVFCNPWRTLCELLRARCGICFDGRIAYPAWLAYYPALALYIAFIWIELFGHGTPRQLALMLTAYTLLTVAMAWLFGSAAWFRHGEFFGLFLSLVGRMAPIAWRRAGCRGVALRWRLPLSGLLERHPGHVSLVLFILFMLSSTAYDGAHETWPWSRLFWKTLYPLVEPAVKAHSAQPYATAASLFHGWQWLALCLSPWVYHGVYLFFLALTRRVAASELSTRALASRFALTLVPIAFVYHATHYYTLLWSQGAQLLPLLSDPLGRGWNLFGTARAAMPPRIIDLNIVWHTQVGLILAGHIASVVLAHAEALRIFRHTGRALASQVPMLLLMVALTAVGLWILSLPLAG